MQSFFRKAKAILVLFDLIDNDISGFDQYCKDR